jgi:hypothetical protein
MCECPSPCVRHPEPPTEQRLCQRSLLKTAAMSSVAVAGLGQNARMGTAAAATVDGAYSMAMHIHASFSERFDFDERAAVRSEQAQSRRAPYGSGFGALLPGSTQHQLRRDLATEILANRACGAYIIEVGYPQRAGATWRHLGLSDVLSRNALFLTGIGVSDDHLGVDRLHPPNVTTWTTSAWAPTRRRVPCWLRCAPARHGAARWPAFGGADPDGRRRLSDEIGDGVHLAQTQPSPAPTNIPGAAASRPFEASSTTPTQRLRSRAPGWWRQFRHATSRRGAVASCRHRRVVVRPYGGAGRHRHGRCASNPVWLFRETPRAGIPAARVC